MINLHERMLPTSAGVEPATSWSPVGRRIQLSHRGRLYPSVGPMWNKSTNLQSQLGISVHKYYLHEEVGEEWGAGGGGVGNVEL